MTNDKDDETGDSIPVDGEKVTDSDDTNNIEYVNIEVTADANESE